MNKIDLIRHLNKFKGNLPICICITNPSKEEYDETQIFKTDDGEEMVFVQIENLYLNTDKIYLDEDGDLAQGDFITLII